MILHKTRKLNQLKKVYNDISDSCTDQFALHYTDWLTDGAEAPSIPSINVPFVSAKGIQHEGMNGCDLEYFYVTENVQNFD